MFKLCFLSFAVVLTFSGFSSAAQAEIAPQSIGSFGKWQAYRYEEGGSPVCFVSVSPEKSEGNYKRRDPVYLMVTHRPAEAAMNVVSFLAGYSFKAGQEVTLRIDDQRFVFLGQDNAAWTPDAATDEKVVNALKKGNKVVVEGVSARGTKTKDSFSLKGSGEALKAIAVACP